MLGPVGANIIQPHHWGNNAAAPTRDAKAVHELNVIMQWHFVRFFLAPLGFCKPTDGLGIAIDVFTIKHQFAEIGRTSCRERVCQYVSISVVAVALKKKKYEQTDRRRRQQK